VLGVLKGRWENTGKGGEGIGPWTGAEGYNLSWRDLWKPRVRCALSDLMELHTILILKETSLRLKKRGCILVSFKKQMKIE